MNKIVIMIISFLTVMVINPAKAQTEEEQTFEAMAQGLIQAIIQNDQSPMQDYLSDVAFIRQIAAKRTVEMDDKAVQEKLLDPLLGAFESQLNILHTEMKERGLDGSSLEVLEIRKEEETPVTGGPVVMIYLGDAENLAKIPLSYHYKDNRLVVFEIVMAEGAFRDRPSQK